MVLMASHSISEPSRRCRTPGVESDSVKGELVNIFESIITWSKSLKPWEQEAIRRLVVKRELTEADEEDIIKLLKDPPAQGKFTPLEIPHPQPTGAVPVSLVSLRHVAGVNALAPNQTLTFGGPRGLTIVFGDNASGKSGYTKVLKRACRSRDPQPPILPDLFSEDAPPPAAKAEFVLRSGNAETTEPWTDGEPSSEDLANVAVFDSKCARLYVEKEGELAYRPYGLEVFDELGDAYRSMKKHLSDEAVLVQVPRCMTVFEDLKVKAAVDAVLLDNSEAKVAEVTKLGTVSDEEKKEAVRLQTQITQLENDDPRKLAVSRRTLAARLTSTVQKITTAHTKLQTSAKLLGDAMTKASDETEAAKSASKAAFAKEPVSGVGTEQWKAMFLDAKAFSTEVAYPGQEFPVIGDGSFCVLCHQTLDEVAKDRLTRFADYIGNKAEERAQVAVKTYDDLRSAAIEAAKGIAEVDDALIEQVLERDDAAAKKLKTIRAGFAAWQTSAGAVSTPAQWSKLTAPVVDTAKLTALTAKLGTEADGLEKNSNAEALANLKGKLGLLNDRIALSKVLPTIKEGAERGAEKRKLQALSDSIDTGPVSRKASETADLVLTKALCEALNLELGKLDAKSLRVEFAKRVDGGVVLHYLRLKNAPKRTKVEDVLSEGEHRCLATAAFLAELGQQGHSSAIVLDDPVSSLDHKHRDKLALRLVEEAASRQVVIFTHDLAFLHAVRQAAAETQTPVRGHVVARSDAGTGVPDDRFYPEALTVRELVAEIRRQAAEVALMSANDPKRRGKVVDCYDLIRACWERVVEESLLRGVVGTFDKAVHTTKLSGVLVEDPDFLKVHWGYTKASDLVDAHRTPATAGTARTPGSEELLADADSLETFRAATETKAGELASKRKKLLKPPAH